MGHETAVPCAGSSKIFESGKLDLLDKDGKPVRDMGAVSKAIDAELEEFLQQAAQTALLMG